MCGTRLPILGIGRDPEFFFPNPESRSRDNLGEKTDPYPIHKMYCYKVSQPRSPTVFLINFDGVNHFKLSIARLKEQLWGKCSIEIATIFDLCSLIY
jgi:hypothetical protein